MKIAAVQTEIYWEDVSKNLQHFKALVGKVESEVDVIVFPEMFLSGFTNSPEICAIEMNGPEIKEISAWARNYEKAIVGSVAVKDEGQYFNRLIWFMPDGSTQYYDKKHLFTYASEDTSYQAGNQNLVVEFKGFKIASFVCYDLRFPVWMRNRMFNGEVDYDLAIVVANWPQVRFTAWENLLKARAIENQCYVLGINRIGVDGNDIKYNGKTMFIEPSGEYQQLQDSQEQLMVVNIDLSSLRTFRKKFPFLNDADSFSMNSK